VEGAAANSGTAIDDKGLLSVAAGESAETLTVRAASKADPGKSGTAAITVSIPVVTGVSVSPQTITLSKGGQHKFISVVEVEGTGSPSQEVVWTVEGAAMAAGCITPEPSP
jgi:hypothetical protein